MKNGLTAPLLSWVCRCRSGKNNLDHGLRRVTVHVAQRRIVVRKMCSTSIAIPCRSSVVQAPTALLNFFNLDRARITDLLISLGWPAYTALQLWEAIYAHGANDVENIQTLSRDKRLSLAQTFRFDLPVIEHEEVSSDGTIKWLMSCPQDSGETDSTRTRVEVVYIPSGGRRTLCVSSQAGCSLACTFCRTGTQKLQRNLSAGDIAGQVLIARRRLKQIESATSARPLGLSAPRTLDNIVFMGQGEPGYNPTHVLTALRILTAGHLTADALPRLSPFAVQHSSFPPQRITISTAGVAPFITRLSKENAPYRLAVSLHAPSDVLRTAIMPINATYPLKHLLAACAEYVSRRILLQGNAENSAESGSPMLLSSMRHWFQCHGDFHNSDQRIRVSFEYVLLCDVNDGISHARELSVLLGSYLPLQAVHVNLLHFNPWPGVPYTASSPSAALEFHATLRKCGIHSTLRKSRGSDVLGACGQLKSSLDLKVVRKSRDASV
jgi:23S rRNA (adenine2503-C2)-methyltransferase